MMVSIRTSSTKPEGLVRKALSTVGCQYRLGEICVKVWQEAFRQARIRLLGRQAAICVAGATRVMLDGGETP